MIATLLAFASRIPIAAYLVGGGVLFGLWQYHRADSARDDLRERVSMEARAESLALQASIGETKRRITVQKEKVNASAIPAARAASAAASAVDALERLQQRIADLQSRARSGDSSATSASETIRISNELGTCAARYQSVAATADKAIIAGSLCQSLYESLEGASK